jgi:hypothetical protein
LRAITGAGHWLVIVGNAGRLFDNRMDAFSAARREPGNVTVIDLRALQQPRPLPSFRDELSDLLSAIDRRGRLKEV